MGIIIGGAEPRMLESLGTNLTASGKFTCDIIY
jgi:hypothetical protein